jgi:hypothetical protein
MPDADKLTPDEIIERRNKVAKLKSEIETDVYGVKMHLDSLMAGVLFALELGVKLAPEPAPPGKAERIREAIRVARTAFADYGRALREKKTCVGRPIPVYPDYFHARVFDLINLLEQDDCKEPPEPEPPNRAKEIRGRVKRIREAYTTYGHSFLTTRERDLAAFCNEVFTLLPVLDSVIFCQDDPNV